MDVPDEQLENTFRTNVSLLFYMTKVALPSNGGKIRYS